MHQLIKFVIVGSLAAFVHLGVLRVMVGSLSLSPLMGNAIAFAIAFIVSYTGQSLWTFNHKQHQHQGTILRFLVTQLLCSFALNQGLYALILKFTLLNYMVASFIVLITVPLVTFTLSKYWAFK
ncbi:GtrA family protein [Endozoicomonas sp. Mp262]|uniref:GtrA family protein n=1 Tax=Endozoicomonas sp. Mp262 TaxID=2919499 RepID=UPI0021E02FAB